MKPCSPNARLFNDTKNVNLPNYFLADLPAEATLSPLMISEACQTLKRNRELYLANRSLSGMVSLLSNLGEDWLDPEFPFRKYAMEHATDAGFSRSTLERGLKNFFKQLTHENFRALIAQELGEATDASAGGFERVAEVPLPHGRGSASSGRFWRGPEFQVHIGAGNIPNPAMMSIILGLLTRSAQFLKCASGSSFLPRLLAHSIYDADRKLGACLEIAEWGGGNAGLEDALFAEADCVTATGSDETLDRIRAKLPGHVRFLGYGHRVSFGFVAGEALSGARVAKIVSSAANDVVAWNQRGCLSPHVIYVQRGGDVSPEHFAQLLADELAGREIKEPRGEISPEESAAIASRRAIYEIRAAHSPENTRHWRSEGSTAWTVIFEADPRFQLSCLNRFIYVKPVSGLKALLESADPVRRKVSTVGLAAPEEAVPELAAQLARWGVTRICRLGQMQNPPLTWRHDGRPPLADLVTWTDLEAEL
ncbi:MAG TPA: acyl-CoA reductase [Verrucomicrobiae bacterium]|nr:acyl-CoA reductase [Verrucomicrobiae bacterium]